MPASNSVAAQQPDADRNVAPRRTMRGRLADRAATRHPSPRNETDAIPELVEPPVAQPTPCSPHRWSRRRADEFDVSLTAGYRRTGRRRAGCYRARSGTGRVRPQTTPAPAVQTVYVTAPNPPRTRGNRGVGTLLASPRPSCSPRCWR